MRTLAPSHLLPRGGAACSAEVGLCGTGNCIEGRCSSWARRWAAAEPAPGPGDGVRLGREQAL